VASTDLLVHTVQESGVAGILAYRIKERVYANQRHIQTVVIESALERVEGIVEIVDAKIIDADLICGAWADSGR
jgi:hypothetical protein